MAARKMVLLSDARPEEGSLVWALCRQQGVALLYDRSGQVVELARQYQPSVICLDVQQRGGRGLELLAELRQQVSTRRLPVLATGTVLDDFVEGLCDELEAELVPKPFDARFADRLIALAQGNPRRAIHPLREIPLRAALRQP